MVLARLDYLISPGSLIFMQAFFCFNVILFVCNLKNIEHNQSIEFLCIAVMLTQCMILAVGSYKVHRRKMHEVLQHHNPKYFIRTDIKSLPDQKLFIAMVVLVAKNSNDLE